MKILFVYPGPLGFSSFIKKDADILASKHRVRIFAFDRTRKDIWPLIKAMNKSDLVFSWFCGLHALCANIISKILNKPSITVVGGYEVAKVPQINYGQFTRKNHKFITLWGLKLTSRVFNVSNYSRIETISNAKISPIKMKTIYHGFTDEVFKRDPRIHKKNIVLTIAHINQMSSVKKGLALFVQSAKLIPEVEFVLVGPDVDGTGKELKKISSSNVTFTGGLFGEDLAALCNQAKVYVQASVHESFGCSVAEAMLCGCLPVVSNTSALPEVVGGTGYYVEQHKPENLAKQINKALEHFDAKESECINRVKTIFPLSLRHKYILEEVEGLTPS